MFTPIYSATGRLVHRRASRYSPPHCPSCSLTYISVSPFIPSRSSSFIHSSVVFMTSFLRSFSIVWPAAERRRRGRRRAGGSLNLAEIPSCFTDTPGNALPPWYLQLILPWRSACPHFLSVTSHWHVPDTHTRTHHQH